MQKIKRIGAGILGVVMAGASLLTPIAMAQNNGYTLADYPQPFITDGNTNFLMVIGTGVEGAEASVADVVGAINVAARLGAEPKGEPIQVGAAATAITGGEEKEMALNEQFSNKFGTLKDNDLAGFQDTSIKWNSKDVDIEETLDTAGLALVTSDSDNQLGSKVYLGTTSSPANLKYSYVIDDSDFDYISVNSTSSKKLDISFLGRDFKVTGVTNATNDKITFKFGQDVTLGIGETATVSDTQVEVTSIGTSSVAVKLGDTTKIISNGDTYDFGPMSVKVDSILYTDDVGSRKVSLTIGSDIQKTVQDGDSMEAFGEPSDSNKAEWVWYIDADDSDTSKLTIGAKYNQKLLDHKDALKTKGEYFTLPNDYAKVSINNFNTNDYVNITGSFDNYIDLDLDESGSTTASYQALDGFVLDSSASETGFRVNVSGTLTETDKVYLLKSENKTIGAFENSDNDKQIFFESSDNNASTTPPISTELDLYYQDSSFDVSFTDDNTALALTIPEGVEGDIVYDIDLSGKKLGSTQGQADPAELTVNGVNQGTTEYDYRTQYGFILRDPNSNGDSDEIAFSMPSEQLKVSVVAQGPGTTVTTTEGQTVRETVPMAAPILDDGIAALDTDPIVDKAKTDKNLILIGSPAVNRITAQALGLEDYPVYGSQWTADANMSAKVQIPGKGNAVLNMVNDAFTEGKVALVVAGWSAADTQAACTVLQQYKKGDYGTYDLSNDEFTVGSTTVKVVK